MKYIMVQHDIGNGVIQKLPIIFPKQLVHRFMAQAIVPYLRHRHGFDNVEVVSAGECNLVGACVVCSGESETLKLKAAPGDADIIMTFDYTQGLDDLEPQQQKGKNAQ